MEKAYFQPDPDNRDFMQALEVVLETNRNLYLTGRAGTGKTTFLRYIKAKTNKQAVILAPTGVAAINAGGVTIHSFFQVPFGPLLPNDRRFRTLPNRYDTDKSTIFHHFGYSKEKREILNSLELLIIDEVSMVRCDLLDLIDRLLRVFRQKPATPFGGVQVLMIGDVFQLAPVVKNEEREILQPFYRSTFFFAANVLQNTSFIFIELKKIYRQKDDQFISLLNKIRENTIDHQDLYFLNRKLQPNFEPPVNSNYITLAAHNNSVEKINRQKLESLEGESMIYEAEVKDDFPERDFPTDFHLELKVGAQVMFLKNSPDKLYFNGKIGFVTVVEAMRKKRKLRKT